MKSFKVPHILTRREEACKTASAKSRNDSLAMPSALMDSPVKKAATVIDAFAEKLEWWWKKNFNPTSQKKRWSLRSRESNQAPVKPTKKRKFPWKGNKSHSGCSHPCSDELAFHFFPSGERCCWKMNSTEIDSLPTDSSIPGSYQLGAPWGKGFYIARFCELWKLVTSIQANNACICKPCRGTVCFFGKNAI